MPETPECRISVHLPLSLPRVRSKSVSCIPTTAYDADSGLGAVSNPDDSFSGDFLYVACIHDVLGR